MNKFIAIVALAVVACAAGAMASICVGENCDWHCGAGYRKATFSLPEVTEWSNNNNKLCKAACKKSGDWPVYKDGNWGLFTDGVRCCCSVRHLFSDGHYHETRPIISNQAAEKFNIDAHTNPSD